MALDNLRLINERREHETHDPLTGLLNFRQLRERAAFELARAERYGRKVAFAMLDLDDFRAVNETVGREGGDEVLCHWAAALTAQLRSCDLVCRYGADEFLLVLPETAEQQADAVLARVLGAMQQLAVEVGGRAFALTASAGVASFPDDGRTAEELVAKAAHHHVRGPCRQARGASRFYSRPAAAPEPRRRGGARRDPRRRVAAPRPRARRAITTSTCSGRCAAVARARGQGGAAARPQQAEVLRDEGRRLLAAWPRAPVVAALAVDGRAPRTEAFAAWLQRGFERGGVGFVIGGSLGLAAEVLARADERLSLSALTLPHQLARVVLARAGLPRRSRSLRGEPYHH